MFLFYINAATGGSRAAAVSKVELFVIIVNCSKPLTIITKSSSMDVAAVLDPPLQINTLKSATRIEDSQFYLSSSNLKQ